MRKVYVSVIVQFDEEGTMRPKFVRWEDNTLYEIDRVLDVRRAASLKAGGIGLRYTIRIHGKATHLYFEDPQWFVEGKA